MFIFTDTYPKGNFKFWKLPCSQVSSVRWAWALIFLLLFNSYTQTLSFIFMFQFETLWMRETGLVQKIVARDAFSSPFRPSHAHIVSIRRKNWNQLLFGFQFSGLQCVLGERPETTYPPWLFYTLFCIFKKTFSGQKKAKSTWRWVLTHCRTTHHGQKWLENANLFDGERKPIWAYTTLGRRPLLVFLVIVFFFCFARNRSSRETRRNTFWNAAWEMQRAKPIYVYLLSNTLYVLLGCLFRRFALTKFGHFSYTPLSPELFSIERRRSSYSERGSRYQGQ